MSHKFNLNKNIENSSNKLPSNKFPKKASNYSLKTEATTVASLSNQDYSSLKTDKQELKNKLSLNKNDKPRNNLKMINSSQNKEIKNFLSDLEPTKKKEKHINRYEDEEDQSPKKSSKKTNNNIIMITDTLNMNELKIMNMIGKGSYGNIYQVEEVKTNQKLAMKKLIADGPDELQKFKNNIALYNSFNLLGKNSNKNILPYFKYLIKKLDITTYSIYITMPLAECDWHKLITDKKNIQSEKVLHKFLKCLAIAGSFLQKSCVAHRDIKPQNVLITKQNEIFLTDFDEAINVKTAIGIYDIRGSEAYMSPILEKNLILGQKKVKHNVFKSDVYSLGLSFVYAMTKNLEILPKIKKCEDDKVNEKLLIDNIIKGGKYSDDFIKTIMKMVAYEEKNRFDFHELAELFKKNK
jgi:thiamine kinase-like enzyme